MKISWKWLNKLVDLENIALTEFTNQLTLAGFEVEQIENNNNLDDVIIDLSITTNRSDASYLIGFAREVSIVFNRELNQELITFKSLHNKDSSHNHYKIIKNQQINSINIDIISNINNTITPQWLYNFLISYEIKPDYLLNNIIQYINIKWGQDIAIFDLDKINTETNLSVIEVKKNNNFNNIIHHQLNQSQHPYVLTYNKQPISILGIKDNKNLIPTANTSSILITSYTCDPQYIKYITNILKIKTIKSTKHIKETIKYDFINAYNEAIHLIINLSKGNILSSYRQNYIKNQANLITITKNEIFNILGPTKNEMNKYLSEKEILQILTQLQCNTYIINNSFKIQIPSHRLNDLTRKIDIIEEIGRIHGFNTFIENLPSKFKQTKKPTFNLFIRKIRQILRNIGLHEVVHYSLKKQPIDISIPIYNPLIEDQSHLRNNLLKSLIKTKAYNIKQKNLLIEIFEIGKIFKINTVESSNIQEEIRLAGILGNPNYIKQNWSETPKPLSWFQAKGQLEELFDKLNASIEWTTLEDQLIKSNIINTHTLHTLFNTKKTTIAYNTQTFETIGVFGQLNLKLAKTYQINPLTYLFELNIYKLFNAIQQKHHTDYPVNSYSNYPSVTRDITFLLQEKESIASIIKKIKSIDNPLQESIEIMNEYKQKNNKKSVCIRITYRSKQRTLNEADLTNINQTIDILIKL